MKGSSIGLAVRKPRRAGAPGEPGFPDGAAPVALYGRCRWRSDVIGPADDVGDAPQWLGLADRPSSVSPLSARVGDLSSSSRGGAGTAGHPWMGSKQWLTCTC